MPGKRRAVLTLCRHCLCHCGYVIRHLVASMHSFIAHYQSCCQVITEPMYGHLPAAELAVTCHHILSDAVAVGCCVMMLSEHTCCAHGAVLAMVDIVLRCRSI